MLNPTGSETGKKNLLTVVLKDKAALYASFMPFIKGGGIFIPTNQLFRLGEEVFVLVKFMDEIDKLNIVGEVIWITPRGAQGGRAAGIGIKFKDDKNSEILKKFETVLAGSEKAERATHTL